MSHENAAEVVRKRFKVLDEIPKDRLDHINKIFQLKTAVVLSLAPLDALITEGGIAAEYSKEEIELIYEHVHAAAEPIKELYEYFIEQSKRFAEKYQFAV